jgi:hypothetical protein
MIKKKISLEKFGLCKKRLRLFGGEAQATVQIMKRVNR